MVIAIATINIILFAIVKETGCGVTNNNILVVDVCVFEHFQPCE